MLIDGHRRIHWQDVLFVVSGFTQVLEILEKFWNFKNLIPKVWNLEFGFGKVLEIRCQMARTVQYTYDLAGWPFKFYGLFCPVT